MYLTLFVMYNNMLTELDRNINIKYKYIIARVCITDYSTPFCH